MGEDLKLQPRGLWVDSNVYSVSPPGSLAECANVIVPEVGTVRSRPGFKGFLGTLVAAKKLFRHGTGTMGVWANDLFRWDDGAGAWTAGSALTAPATNYLPKSATFQNLLFVTSGAGVQFLSPTVTPTRTGLDAVPQVTCDLLASGGVTEWLSNGNAVRVRAVLTRTLPDGTLLLSPPSAPFLMENDSGSPAFVGCTVSLPADAVAGDVMRIYRSFETTDPSDEMFLGFSQAVTSGNVTDRYMTMTAGGPDSTLTTPLYTNESQEGIVNANYPPPFARDVASFNSMAVFSDIKSRQEAVVTLLNVLAVNDTITIGGLVFTAKSSETIASRYFDQSSADIAETVRSLVNCINFNTGVTGFKGVYLDGGSFQVLSNAFTDTPITITHSGSASLWSAPTATTNNPAPGTLAFSKPAEPQSVPLLARLVVGAANVHNTRVLQIKDSLLVFKADATVYRVSGANTSEIQCDLVFNKMQLQGDEAVETFEDTAVAWTQLGAVATDGFTYNPIDTNKVQSLYQVLVGGTYTYMAKVRAFSSRRLLAFGVPEADSAAIQFWLVYSAESREWTRWARTDVDALAPDSIYFLRATQATVERPLSDERQFSDEAFAVTVVTIPTSTSVTLSSTAGIEAGDLVVQNLAQATVESVDGSTVVFTEASGAAFVAGAATVYQAFEQSVVFNREFFGDPSLIKRYTEGALLFGATVSGVPELGQASNFSPVMEWVSLPPYSTGAFGLTPFGEGPFGGAAGASPATRFWPTRNAARCLWLNLGVRQASAGFDFELFGVVFRGVRVSSRYKATT